MNEDALRDPLCDMPADPSVAPRATFAGHDYLFCSSSCGTSSMKDPEAALARKPPSPNEERR